MNPELQTILNSIANEVARELAAWRVQVKEAHTTIIDCIDRGDLFGMAKASVDHAGLLDQLISIMHNRLGPIPNLTRVIDPVFCDQVFSDPSFKSFLENAAAAVVASKPTTPAGNPLSDEERHGLQLMPDQVFDAARNIHAQACTRPDCELHRAFEAEVRRRQTQR